MRPCMPLLSKPRRRQAGGLLALVLLGLAGAGVLATIAYGSYYQIARGTQDTVTRTHTAGLLTQAAYTLATETTDSDGDGTAEPPAGLLALGDGWEIPSSSGAPKADAWGSALKYCPWDNGSSTASAGRLAGANPALQSSIQFALVSGGPDKTFSTSCNQAKIAALGDDGVRLMTVAQLNQGVGGTYFYGDPVASVLGLPASGAPTGMLRLTLDTQVPYVWNGSSWLPLPAGAWLVVVAGADCTAYLPGTLARDAADDLYLCKANAPRNWKKVQ
jgi:hypothetical protein